MLEVLTGPPVNIPRCNNVGLLSVYPGAADFAEYTTRMIHDAMYVISLEGLFWGMMGGNYEPQPSAQSTCEDMHSHICAHKPEGALVYGYGSVRYTRSNLVKPAPIVCAESPSFTFCCCDFCWHHSRPEEKQ